MPRIASFNVNSIRSREQHVLSWLKETGTDIALLQELKATEDQVPLASFKAAGYEATVLGQKAYNGVAILSRYPLEDISLGLPGNEEDEQARYIEATVDLPEIGKTRIATLYAPNGNPMGTEKFTYKCAFTKKLVARFETLMKEEIPFLIGGDYNIIPTDKDVYSPKAFADDALTQSEIRRMFRQILNLGMTDALKTIRPTAGHYTFWDYQAGAWQKNNGLRIDHLMLSPELADRLENAGVDKNERAKEKPSDHAPVWCILK